jgi:hypothetical protein
MRWSLVRIGGASLVMVGALVAGVVGAHPAAASAQASRNGASNRGSFRSAAASQPGRGLWSIIPSPNASNSDYLSGVSCIPKTGRCVAVGASGAEPLAEVGHRSTWYITSAQIPPFSVSSILHGVTCLSPDSCFAVGENSLGTVVNTLVEFWNGSTWSIIPSPNEGGQNDELQGVACVTSTSCMAVGAYYDGTAYQTLIERWDGTTWAILPSPDPGGSSQTNQLFGLACTSTTACMAVGFYSNGTFEQTLAVRWNGTSWAQLPTPNTGSFGSQLAGVSCPALDLCVAVGIQFTALGNSPLTLGEIWRGAGWTVTPTPNPPGTGISSLGGVACGAPNRCTAAGDAYIGNPQSSPQQTLVEHWNGSRWTIDPTPNRPGLSNGLLGVSCVGPVWAYTCTAVGESFDPQQTLIMAR